MFVTIECYNECYRYEMHKWKSPMYDRRRRAVMFISEDTWEGGFPAASVVNVSVAVVMSIDLG